MVEGAGQALRVHFVSGIASQRTTALHAACLASPSALQGCCRLLLVDNIAANVWHDRAAVFSASNQQLPFTTQQHPGWPSQSYSMQQQYHPQQQPGMQGGYGMGGSHHQEGPGFDALRVQKAVAVLLQAVSQQWRVPVVVSKQTGVHQLERAGTAKLVQREVLTEPLQVCWVVDVIGCVLAWRARLGACTVTLGVQLARVGGGLRGF